MPRADTLIYFHMDRISGYMLFVLTRLFFSYPSLAKRWCKSAGGGGGHQGTLSSTLYTNVPFSITDLGQSTFQVSCSHTPTINIVVGNICLWVSTIGAEFNRTWLGSSIHPTSPRWVRLSRNLHAHVPRELNSQLVFKCSSSSLFNANIVSSLHCIILLTIYCNFACAIYRWCAIIKYIQVPC